MNRSFKNNSSDITALVALVLRICGDMQIFYAFMFAQYRKHLEQEITSYTEAMSQKTEPKKGKGNGYSLFFNLLAISILAKTLTTINELSARPIME